MTIRTLPGKVALFLLGFAVIPVSMAQTPVLKPETFAYHTGITLAPNGGPFYQFALPLPVYQGIQHQDLGDLRVFNSQGEVVPHTLIQPQATSTSQDKSISVLVFPVTASTTTTNGGDVDIALSVQRQSDGTLISVKSKSHDDKQAGSTQSTTQGTTQGAIFDISQIREEVHALHLQTAASSIPFHAFSIETSDDLQQWHTLLDDAQLVHLQQGGQVINKDQFEWDGKADKYLRLIWRDPAQAPAILSASVLSTQTTINSTGTQWTDAIHVQKAEGNHYDYTFSGHIPLEKLRIGLAQTNTLAPLQIQHYYFAPTTQHQQGHWETLAQTVVYRLQSPQGEVKSPDIMLNGLQENTLRLAVDGNSAGLGNIPPTLQIGFTPQILVFLARGNGPFTLVWGAKSVTDASMAAGTLLPGYQPDKAIAASPATLQPVMQVAAATNQDAETEQPQKKTSKVILWGVLVVGLGVLAAMVMALLKQMRQGTPTDHSK